MQRIAVINSKGGVGKTTTVVCLAGALVERGRRVLIVDLDPQASASLWLGTPTDGSELLDALFEKKPNVLPLVRQLPVGIDLIPGGLFLNQFDSRTLQDPLRFLRVRRALNELPESWDYVFMDTPGAFGVLAMNALIGADSFLVPVEPAMLSVDPTVLQFQTIDEVREAHNPRLACAGILACRLKLAASNPGQLLGLFRSHFGDLVFETVIRDNVNLAEAPAQHTPVTAYMSRSNGAQDYRALAAEFEARLARPVASPPTPETNQDTSGTATPREAEVVNG